MSGLLPPLCSVVIATYRRPAQLSRCLAALTRLDYPHDRLEVIVVDDGGTVPLDNVVASYRGPLNLRLATRENGGPGAARNTGAELASGSIIAFTDDDCRPTAEWLTRLVTAIGGSATRGAGGHTVNALRRSGFARASQLIIDAGYAHSNVPGSRARFLTTNNMALPRAMFRELGGFDPAFRTSEDRELCSRWLANGGELVYEPEAVVHHAHEFDLAGFWRQNVAYGHGTRRFHVQSRDVGREAVQIEPRFYLDLLRAPFGRESLRDAIVTSALIGIAHLGYVLGYVHEMRAHARK